MAGAGAASGWLSSLLAVLLVVLHSSPTLSLRTTSSSPCKSVCDSTSASNATDNIVCVNSQFDTTTNGSRFQECVECELGSSAADSSTEATDVTWGLYHLRYAFSTCVFNFPTQKISVSTPCQVSCDPLKNAIESKLGEDIEEEDLGFCEDPSFNDTVEINRCAECYSQMEEQSYMANFLQALHIACLDPPTPPETFPVAAQDIFSTVLIPTPTPDSDDEGGSGTPANLPLIIALPAVFGGIILASIAVFCFYSARRRRRIMADRNNMRTYHDKASPGSGSSTYHLNPSERPYSPASGFQSPSSVHPHHFYPNQGGCSPPQDPSLPPAALVGESKPSAQDPNARYPSPDTNQNLYQHHAYSPLQYASLLPNSKYNTNATHFAPSAGTSLGPLQQRQTLHDQYFPLPPPPSHQPPPGPGTTQMPASVVEPLSQHQRKTPSLLMPVPKKQKKKEKQAEAAAEQQQQQQQQQSSTLLPPAAPSLDAQSRNSIQPEDFTTTAGESDIQGGNFQTDLSNQQDDHSHSGHKSNNIDTKITGGSGDGEDSSDSPAQVLVYDQLQGRYIKQTEPQPSSNGGR